jgi:hypothetical protein
MKEKLWTIQHEKACYRLFRKGVLHADERFLMWNGEFRTAYSWMADEMRARIGTPPAGAAYPIWAWHSWEGRRDSRTMSALARRSRGNHMLLIEFEIEASRVLMSDFDNWHLVLIGSYIARSERDLSEFYAAGYADEHERIRASWERIFCLDDASAQPGWDTPPSKRSIQATLWEIRPDDILSMHRLDRA